MKEEGDKELRSKVIECSKMVENDPLDYHAFNERGTCEFQLHDFEGALNDYKRALKINPDFAKGYYNLGLLYHNLERLHKAIYYYGKAIKIDPEFAEAYCNRGVVKAQKKHFKSALNDFNKAIERKMELIIAYQNKSFVKKEMELLKESH